jgi:hypothetical protein
MPFSDGRVRARGATRDRRLITHRCAALRAR